jgi:hypothetical protein
MHTFFTRKLVKDGIIKCVDIYILWTEERTFEACKRVMEDVSWVQEINCFRQIQDSVEVWKLDTGMFIVFTNVVDKGCILRVSCRSDR